MIYSCAEAALCPLWPRKSTRRAKHTAPSTLQMYQQHLAFALSVAFHMHKAAYRKVVSIVKVSLRSTVRTGKSYCPVQKHHLERLWYPQLQRQCLLRQPLSGPGVRHQCRQSCELLGPSPDLQPSLLLISQEKLIHAN